MVYKFRPSGVCSMEMIVDIENDVIKSAEIVGGCPGNTLGVSTSCPDQLARGLEKIKEENK